MEILSIARSIVDLFFPMRCLGCNDIVSSKIPICVDCGHQLPFTHWKFDSENPAFHKIRNMCEIETANSLLFFEKDNISQKLLHALKYRNQPKVGNILAEKMELETNLYDGIIIIPIHSKKLKQRGYNQVKPFAETISNRFEIPLIENYLYRKENNSSQVSKSRTQRLNSLNHAFDVYEQPISGHYLLIDDLLTTGATISTCVNLLKSKNDIKISVLTIGFAI